MLKYPITVTITNEGHVTIESGDKTVAGSQFSERSKRLHDHMGTGTHTLANENALLDLPEVAWLDIEEALS